MATNYNKQPNQPFDLNMVLEGNGTTANQSVDVRAFVTDPTGIAVSGSPFTLAHEARGEYVLRNAFSCDIIGIYRIHYMMYSTYPTQNFSWREQADTIDVKYEESGGSVIMRGSGDEDSDNIKKIAEAVWRYDISKIKNPKTAIRQIFDKLNINIPEVKLDKVINEVLNIPSKIIIPKQEKPEKIDFSQIIEYLKVLDHRMKQEPDYTCVFKGLRSSNKEIVNKLKRHIDIKTSKIIKINAKDIDIDFTPIYSVINQADERERKRLKFILNKIRKFINEKDSK